jgi:hypothetical protein
MQQNMILSAASDKVNNTGSNNGPSPSKRYKYEHNTSISGGEQSCFGEQDPIFLCPSQQNIKQCTSDFIDHTSNNALAKDTCMSCARSIWRHDTIVTNITDIPNADKLIPTSAHPSHVLTDGMLLHNGAVRDGDAGKVGSICHDCMRDLKSCKKPKFSLANEMWIGDIPFELSVLTIPEKIIIARYFPVAYVVKLFPKKKGARFWNPAGLNSGVRGNVSTYRLNTDDIADMKNPKVMPPTSRILAAVIGITIIGPQGLPEKSMTGFLKIRRARVRAALVWLKNHNPLYSVIEISEEILNEYPENGIPQEILSIVKYSDDVEQLEKERAGYVVEDDDNEDVTGT